MWGKRKRGKDGGDFDYRRKDGGSGHVRGDKGDSSRKARCTERAGWWEALKARPGVAESVMYGYAK